MSILVSPNDVLDIIVKNNVRRMRRCPRTAEIWTFDCRHATGVTEFQNALYVKLTVIVENEVEFVIAVNDHVSVAGTSERGHVAISRERNVASHILRTLRILRLKSAGSDLESEVNITIPWRRSARNVDMSCYCQLPRYSRPGRG
jgi:hypothetical protein